MGTCNAALTRWVEIDTDAISYNVGQLRKKLKHDTKIMAVVKGDAYGCGSVECAKAAVKAGCDMLGVTTLEEALELRLNGISDLILVFSPLLPSEVNFFVEYNLIPTIVHKESLILFAETVDTKRAVHLKIETGMGRLGLRISEVHEILDIIRDLPNIQLHGVYTHFAKAIDSAYVKKQVSKLTAIVNACREKGFTDFIVHASASAAFLKYPEYSFDMIRIGTLLYGQAPAGIAHNLDLRDPWAFKARILQLKEISSGESVGYGRDYIASKGIKIAIIAIGLADGFTLDPPRKAKNLLDLIKIIAKEMLKFLGRPPKLSGTIMHNGRVLPIVGRIGMQLLAVDVTAVRDITIDDFVDVVIRRTSASARLPRVYTSEGRAYAIRTIAQEQVGDIFAVRGERA